MPEGRRFAQCWPLLPLYRLAGNILAFCAVRLHDPDCSGVSVGRHRRCGRTVMRPVMAIARAVSKSRWIAAAAVVVLVIAAGAGWLFFGHAAKPPQAAAAPPAPAVGVRAATMKGVSQSFEFVGRIKAIEQGRAAGARRGLPREGAVPRGPGRQGRRAALSDREGAVPVAVDQAKANLAVGRGRADQCQARV